MEAKIPTELPTCCLQVIFNKLNHASERDSFSLVCKEFLSITNSLKDSLYVVSPLIQDLTRMLRRFPHLKKIQLVNFPGDLTRAILEIAQSGLSLEALDLSCNENLPAVCLEELGSCMKNLKVLCCSRSSLTDADLVRIANCFPQIEELDISDSYFPHKVDGKTIAVTDEGIEFLSSKLIRLHRVDLSGNQCISDKSLIAISSNCAYLEKIVVGYCNGVTEHGVSFLLHNSTHLTSLVLRAHFEIKWFGVKGSGMSFRNLGSLKFSRVKISDEFLFSVAEAHIPLTEFSLIFCKGYTFTGISSLLQTYRSIRTLVLLGADFLTNEHINQLSPFLLNLSSIKLYTCPNLSDSAFIMLSERCPLLTCLEMGESGIGNEECHSDSPVKNFTIRSLSLSSNDYLSSTSLRRLLRICPNLEKLDLSNCFQRIHELDVADILNCNSTVKILELNGCCCLKFSTREAMITRLEKVVAEYSGINDEGLAMIGSHCPGLLHLDLKDCENITEKGVTEVVKSCTRLGYLSLSACSNVNVNAIEYIVKNRASLRRLVSSSALYPNDEEQKYFLEHGCLVTRGVDYEELLE